MNLPCINCLIFPICKARYNIIPKKHQYDYNQSFSLFHRRQKVMENCSLISDFFHEQKRVGYSKMFVDEFHAFFSGVSRYE